MNTIENRNQQVKRRLLEDRQEIIGCDELWLIKKKIQPQNLKLI